MKKFFRNKQLDYLLRKDFENTSYETHYVCPCLCCEGSFPRKRLPGNQMIFFFNIIFPWVLGKTKQPFVIFFFFQVHLNTHYFPINHGKYSNCSKKKNIITNGLLYGEAVYELFVFDLMYEYYLRYKNI